MRNHNTMSNAPSVHNERYEHYQQLRAARLAEAFKVAPDTGHAPGHKYPKK
jgi:hypothetical protein